MFVYGVWCYVRNCVAVSMDTTAGGRGRGYDHMHVCVWYYVCNCIAVSMITAGDR